MIELERYIVRPTEPSALRLALDPYGQLPLVSLSACSRDRQIEDDPRQSFNGGRERTYRVFGKVSGPVGITVAGEMRIGSRPDAEDVYAVTDMDVEPEFAGAARLLAMEATRAAGFRFGTDILTGRQEYLQWVRLVEAKLAHVAVAFEGIAPGVPFEEQRMYSGDAQLGYAL